MLLLRTQLPELGTDQYEWNQIARVVAEPEPIVVVNLLLRLLDQGVIVLEDSEEASLITEAARRDPQEA